MTDKGNIMSELEFACEVFGVKPVMSGKIPRETVLNYMNDWKESRLGFAKWKSLLICRA